MANTKSLPGTRDTFRGRGVLETILTASEAKGFTLNSSLSFTYFPSLSCKCSHFTSEVLEPLIGQSRTILLNQGDLCQLDPRLSALSVVKKTVQNSKNQQGTAETTARSKHTVIDGGGGNAVGPSNCGAALRGSVCAG